MKCNCEHWIKYFLSRFHKDPDKKASHIYCIGFDIVGFSRPERTADIQKQMVDTIQSIIENAATLKTVKRKDVIFLPTGDGMFICLNDTIKDPIIVLKLAQEIQLTLKKINGRTESVNEHIVIRMGIHSGTCINYTDINYTQNLAGPAINTTRRIMDIGKDWQILCSHAIYDNIGKLDHVFKDYFSNVGYIRDKHKETINIYNIYTGDGPDYIGNNTIPPEIVQLEIPSANKPVMTE
jgi:class 3 adenylate cyclase